jgi:CTP:molybdopterin cytidylyltransferase MocA
LTDARDIAVVVLAAGLSTRFGSLHKALPEPFGVGLLERAAGVLRAIDVNKILVVTGARSDEVGAEARRLGLCSVYNENYSRGMGSSILTGLKAAGPGPAMILPVDAAFVSPRSVLAVMGRFRGMSGKSQEKAIIVPGHNGQLGHPPLLGPKIVEEALSGSIDNFQTIMAGFMPPDMAKTFVLGKIPRGSKGSEDQGPIRFLELRDLGVLSDIDGPEDFQAALKAKPRLPPWPTPRELWTLLELVDPGPFVKRHCLAVAKGALRLSLALRGVLGEAAVNPAKSFLGGLIHDVDRLKKNHEAKAAERILALGWPSLSRIVGSHKDIVFPAEENWEDSDLNAALAVYLTDKHYLETEFVSLKTRFMDKIESFQSEKAKAKAYQRLNLAQKVSAWFKDKLGYPPEEAILAPTEGLLETWAFAREREVERDFEREILSTNLSVKTGEIEEGEIEELERAEIEMEDLEKEELERAAMAKAAIKMAPLNGEAID